MSGWRLFWPQATAKISASQTKPGPPAFTLGKLREKLNTGGVVSAERSAHQLNLNTRVAATPVANTHPARIASWGQVVHRG